MSKLLPVKSRDKLGASVKRIESMEQPTRGKGSRKRSSHSYPDTPRPSKLLDLDKSLSKMPSTPLVQNETTEIVAPYLSTKLSSCKGGELHFVYHPNYQLSRFSANLDNDKCTSKFYIFLILCWKNFQQKPRNYLNICGVKDLLQPVKTIGKISNTSFIEQY